MSHNFPALQGSVQGVVNSIEQVLAALNGAPEQYIEASSKSAKDALQNLDDNRSQLEDAKDFGDGSKKLAVDDFATKITVTLWEFAKRISSVYKDTTPSPAIATAIKSLLEKLEDSQGPLGNLAQENDVDFDKTYPGMSYSLPDDLEKAYQTLGGR